ncbi:MAG: DUF2892 domain-containing protein [Planctomycetota bacterium]|nr:DUF2892 domain-containing protein [Planctomycetota bacterium]
MIPATTERVANSTSERINQQIRRDTEESIRRCVAEGPKAIDRRLAELDREWDVERLLETNASSAVIVGSLLALTVDRRFMILPALVGTFLLQHAVQGWCPPLPVIRELGFRTAAEIEEERYTLKALRGDFEDLRVEEAGDGVPARVLDAVRK